jgi:hypothetical protein
MRTQGKEEKKLADDARLLRAWRRWHREELEQAIAGPHGDLVAQFVQILRGLTLQSAPMLLKFVRTQDWRSIDSATRLILLHEVNTAITALRERNNMVPFDDTLDDRLNVFNTIQAIMITPEN